MEKQIRYRVYIPRGKKLEPEFKTLKEVYAYIDAMSENKRKKVHSIIQYTIKGERQ